MTQFRLWAPDHDLIALEIEGRPPVAMTRDAAGVFIIDEPARPNTNYRFRLPSGLAVPDPASRLQSGDVHGWSVVPDPDDYTWKHAWSGRPWHESVILEIHPGAYGGYEGIEADLPRLRALGITAIELMPIADFPGRRNWGYDGVLPYAPDEMYGPPSRLKRLVDAAHGESISVYLDVVYNHFGPDGNYLHAYAGRFFDESRHTPWGAAINFRDPEVRRFFIDNAVMWLTEYRFDGLRFDAVHACEDADFLDDLAKQIRARVPDRAPHLILENEHNEARPLAPRLFDSQWNDDFHHCVHVLLTGESEGYYSGFQDPAHLLARVLSEGFAYQGEAPPGGKKRGEPSAHLPVTAFVVSLQTHDQVGNRALGERPTVLASDAALHAAQTLQLLSPFVPMLFMGEDWGTRRPFLFFTDHNPDLAEKVREGRRREFQHFAAFKDPARRETIPDPNAPETFGRSIVDPAEAEKPEYAAIAERTHALLALRHRFIVPRIPGTRSEGARVIGPKAVEASWRMGDGSKLTLAINLGDAPIPFAPPGAELLYGTADHLALAIDDGALPAFATVAYLAEHP